MKLSMNNAPLEAKISSLEQELSKAKEERDSFMRSSARHELNAEKLQTQNEGLRGTIDFHANIIHELTTARQRVIEEVKKQSSPLITKDFILALITPKDKEI